MPNDCLGCGIAIEISSREAALRAKVAANLQKLTDSSLSLPEPRLCAACRLQRRLAFRNERKLYQRSCGLCGKRTIGLYSPDKPYTVYCHDCWYSDRWNPQDYAREIDFSRPFFEQFLDLWNSVPRLNLIILCDTFNSDYTNDVQRLKNCYLIFDGEQAVDCAYGETFFNLKDCLDFHTLQHCELCYECLNCTSCYELKFSRFCTNCNQSAFLSDCIGCSECFCCVNLHKARFCIFNRQLPEAEYRQQLKQFDLGDAAVIEKVQREFREFAQSRPKKHMRGIRNENVTGDNISNSKDCENCYDSDGLRDCCNCTNVLMGGTDCCDLTVWGNGTSLIYDSCCLGEDVQNSMGCFYVSHGADSVYHSAFCSRGVRDLFGCVGLRHASQRIFNREYEAAEYRRQLKKLVALMQETGELGEFFPGALSGFGYNETMAQEYFPLEREAAIQSGFKWSDYVPPEPALKIVEASSLPQHIGDATDESLQIAIRCQDTGKVFRLTKQEITFYRRHGLALPRRHPDRRHALRLGLRNPRRLTSGKCLQCGSKVETAYSGSEAILCERCYTQTCFA